MNGVKKLLFTFLVVVAVVSPLRAAAVDQQRAVDLSSEVKRLNGTFDSSEYRCGCETPGAPDAETKERTVSGSRLSKTKLAFIGVGTFIGTTVLIKTLTQNPYAIISLIAGSILYNRFVLPAARKNFGGNVKVLESVVNGITSRLGKARAYFADLLTSEKK